jgi:hypothetical protein
VTVRAVFIADGPSDLPLAMHLELLCAQQGVEAQVTPIDPRHMRASSRTVESRLRFLIDQGVDPDLVFVHRDAESQDPAARATEVRAGAVAAGVDEHRVVPVVPIRMTEAWLLIDEPEIRRVAGRPAGTNDLGLPSVAAIESLADPKALLAKVLLDAGQPSGRRRRAQFERDFGSHRALLLERLDVAGRINELKAWRRLKEDVANVLANLPDEERSA